MATSLTTLQQRVQTLYDVSGSTVLSAAELTQFINDAYRALWSEVLGINKNFRRTSLPFTLTTGNLQAIPSDFMEVRYVRLNPGDPNTEVYLVRESERNGSQQYDRTYDIAGTNVVILPMQRAAGTYSLDYIPQPPVLVNGADTLDVELDQFSEFLVYHATIAALSREEGDAAGAFMLLLYGPPGDPNNKGIAGRVRKWAADHRASDPDTVQDVRRRQPWMWTPP